MPEPGLDPGFVSGLSIGSLVVDPPVERLSAPLTVEDVVVDSVVVALLGCVFVAGLAPVGLSRWLSQARFKHRRAATAADSFKVLFICYLLLEAPSYEDKSIEKMEMRRAV